MKKLLSVILVLSLIVIPITGCSNGDQSTAPILDANFNVIDQGSTIVVEDNSESDFEIISIKPILSNEFEKLTILDNHKLILNKKILKDKSLEINGEIIFKTSDLTKKEILDLQPFIKEFEVIEKRIIKKEI